jgi:hypothetical protein
VIRQRAPLIGALLVVCSATSTLAQEAAPVDTRTQYPAFLRNSFFTLNVGKIGYVFSADQLEPGFKATSVDVPHLAVRLDLFGHHFTKSFSAKVTYMRPARFVAYNNVNGSGASGQVSAAYGGVTLAWDVPVSNSLSAYLEGGLGITNRTGFAVDGVKAVGDAHFAAGLVGAGLAYHATPNIDVTFGATYSPGRKSFDQPSTRLFTTGLRYHIRPLPAAQVEANRESGYIFPLNVVRLGYTTNLTSYGVNDFFSRKFPIFWGGDVETRRGFTFDYQRNVFHSKKLFAFDFGASASYWKSDANREIFRTLSVYPLFRFFVARPQAADIYISYSVAGPTYISRTEIDGQNVGERFTFQDFLACGTFFGKARRINAELGIKHYSNGNIFASNAAIKIPLTLTLGWAF